MGAHRVQPAAMAGPGRQPCELRSRRSRRAQASRRARGHRCAQSWGRGEQEAAARVGKAAAGLGALGAPRVRERREAGIRRRKEEGKEKKKKGKRKMEKKKKGERERERKRLRRRVSRRRPRPDEHVRRSGVTCGTRKNREMGRRLDSDVRTGFSGDWEIGRGLFSDGLSSTMKRDLKIFLARDLFW